LFYIFDLIPKLKIEDFSKNNNTINKEFKIKNKKEKILDIIKIKINQKTFNSLNDFQYYLENLGIIIDGNIAITLMKKYQIKITGITEIKNIQRINNIKKSIKNKFDIKKLFNIEEFDFKYMKIFDNIEEVKNFKETIINNFNEDAYNDIAANILTYNNITILDCMNIFHNHDYKETLKNISNFKNLSNYERLEKLKEFNIDINQQTIPQNSSNVEINQQSQIQTIPEKSLVIYVYQGSYFDDHIYYEWENNSLWIEVSCLYNEKNCHETFRKNPMDDFFIVYFCSIFNDYIKKSQNKNLIIYSKDNFSEWNIKKDYITFNDYTKPNNKIIIKQNRNQKTLYRDATIGNTNILDDIKNLFLKLKNLKDLNDEELKLIIDYDILRKLRNHDKFFNFLSKNEYNIEESNISSSRINTSSFYIDRIVEQYHMVLDRVSSEEIFTIFLNHIENNEDFYKLSFLEIHNHFDNINRIMFPQEGRGKIYKISYNI
jgi:hypothetical protein